MTLASAIEVQSYSCHCRCFISFADCGVTVVFRDFLLLRLLRQFLQCLLLAGETSLNTRSVCFPREIG